MSNPPLHNVTYTFWDRLKKEAEASGMQLPQATATQWYRQKTMNLKINRDRLVRDRTRRARNFFIGKMFMYAYDAKTKDDLPYWDAFPLVLPFKILNDGWLGLNFHYIPYKERAILFDNLTNVMNNTRYDVHTRLRVSWEYLKGISHQKLMRPCVHRYLLSHIVSKAIVIQSYDWPTALFLPVSKFIGATSQQVWRSSLSQQK